MCTSSSGPQWKREKVPDHKFDFIDTREFRDNGFAMRFKYFLLYAIVLKSFLVYVLDIFTAITMLTTSGWSNSIFNSCQAGHKDACIPVPFEIGKWIFFGCIITGFLLMAYETRKSKKIIASRDISYAFTNVLANHYYSLRSYDHFCFFDHISNSTKKKDDFAFFVFFTFKDWKRLVLADGPRQAINALTLYSFYLSVSDVGSWYTFSRYFDPKRGLVANAMTCTMAFTVLIFLGSLLLLIAAGVCYVPLLVYIQGNLKEYCCHKVDKRIRDILQRKHRQRQAKALAQAKKEAAGDYSANKSNEPQLPAPTLPNIMLVDEDLDDAASMRTRGPPASTYANSEYYADQKGAGGYEYAAEYPPMPAYNPAQAQAYGYYGQPAGFSDSNSVVQNAYGTHEAYFHDENYSTAHLTQHAPPAGAYDPREAYHQPGHAEAEYADPVDRYSAGSGLAYEQESAQVALPHHVQSSAAPYASTRSPEPAAAGYVYDARAGYGGGGYGQAA